MVKILEKCDGTLWDPRKKLISLRDAALISIGFAAALRRSELCNIKVEDIEFVDSTGSPSDDELNCSFMYLTIRQSKTDQAGRGQRIPIVNGKQLHPVYRLKSWLEEANISEGFVFQTMHRGGSLRGRPLHHSDIPRLVKKYVNQIGLNANEFAGHSLRSGFITSAVIHNARLDKIMEITRHRNPSTVMTYIRDVNSFKHHAGLNFI